MFLKTLTLKGFKSFAESTTLALEPGVTVVVGPNGSGKSNVVDAIGWVLGAQAPSTVRSSKMDDVIFAGTASKAPLGRAEVSLTIDNSSGMLPIEFTEVTITRTLFRSGDSEYALNGVPCRLLDVQELLSDTGVGRQRHIIISQGQIDAVLNARPEERRLIIEEAAGVLKYRRRKEKAERRLTATEANLTRLEDLRREVARELRPLAKQADAARRHQGLADELRALRVHLSGKDLNRLRGRLVTIGTQDREASDAERELLANLARLDSEVLAAESALVAAGGQDVADTLGRCESLREKARGQVALIAERHRRVERDRASELSREVIATLEAEAATVATELASVNAELAALETARNEVDRAEADLEIARSRFADEWSDAGGGTEGARAAEARGELAALEAAHVRGSAELERVASRHRTITDRVNRLAEELEDLTGALTELQRDTTARADAVTTTRQAAEAAETAAEQAHTTSRDAQASRAAWVARVETLEAALDAARARAGIEMLADLDGVVGTLLDVVAVDEGYEAAFESGAGEAIAAVVVREVTDARLALARLTEQDVAGAVLALTQRRPPATTPPTPVAGTTPLRSHVRGIRPGVDELLDVIVGDVLVADGWQDAVNAVVAEPTALVVTVDGGRFAPTGWRISMAGAGATGAALAEARAEAGAATDAAVVAEQAAIDADAARDATRDAARSAQLAVTRAEEQTRVLSDRIDRTKADHHEGLAEIEALNDHRTEVAATLANDAARFEEIAALLPELEAVEAQLADDSRRRDEAQVDIETRAVSVATLRSDLSARAAGLAERREALEQRAADIEARLAKDVAAREQAQERRDEHDRISLTLDRLATLVAGRLELLDGAVAELRVQRRLQSDRVRAETEELEGLRAHRTRCDAELGQCREERQKLGLEATEARVRAEQIAETIRVELDTDPEVAMTAECPELAGGVTPIARVRELERELRRMGTINPLAVAEYTEKSERHEFLTGQVDDVRDSRRELNKVIREVDTQIGGTFAAAFADVRTNFTELFSTLFPGGRGDLMLTDPEDPLSTGIEISARPSGKNVRTLSLLSGGERSLVALAFLFAVFRSRSSPFYVMDEVEAALDDVNLHRFLDLIAEFRSTAQLIIVSHQKRTMEAADALFGVTMQSGGSSKVVSERV